MVIHVHAQSSETFDGPTFMSPADVRRSVLYPLFSSLTIRNCPFHDVFSAIFYAVLCSVVVGGGGDFPA